MYHHVDTDDSNVQWEQMLPWEFREAFEGLPVVYLPLGTVEWHGEHNALGLDAIKAHALCIHAARKSGGIVHPPVYGGMGGLDKPATVVMEGEMDWESHLLRPWLEKMCYEFVRIGFKAIIIITGHYGHNQQIVVRETAARMSEKLRVPILGTAEYWLAHDEGYVGDHAGIGETSLLAYLHPGRVSVERLREDPEYGANDTIEKGFSYELGRTYAQRIAGRMAHIARSMVTWDAPTVEAFVHSERSIVSAQIKGWRLNHPWAAWQHIATGKMPEYGRLLEEEQWEALAVYAGRLLADG